MILRSSRLRADSVIGSTRLGIDNGLQLFGRGQCGAGGGGQSAVVGDRDRCRCRGRCERVAHGRSTLAGAQQDADGGGVDFRAAVLAVDDRDVRAELADVRGLERADLELDDDVAKLVTWKII
jgi:hypothetical protein